MGSRWRCRPARSKNDTFAPLSTSSIRPLRDGRRRAPRRPDFTDLDRDTSTPVAIVNEAMAHDSGPRELWVAVSNSPAKHSCGRSSESHARQLYRLGRARAVLRLCTARAELLRYNGAIRPYDRRPPWADHSRRTRNPCAGPQVVVIMPRTGRQSSMAACSRRVWVWRCSAFSGCSRWCSPDRPYRHPRLCGEPRRREIGLRMALGAEPPERAPARSSDTVCRSCWSASRSAWRHHRDRAGPEPVFFGVSVTDPLSLSAGAAVLIGVALAACYLQPDRRRWWIRSTALRDV